MRPTSYTRLHLFILTWKTFLDKHLLKLSRVKRNTKSFLIRGEYSFIYKNNVGPPLFLRPNNKSMIVNLF